MNKKWTPIILVLILGVVLFIVKKYETKNLPPPKPNVTNNNNKKDPSVIEDRNRGFDRRTSFLEYSNHAKCRMDCRHITQAEVVDIMKNGEVNYNKSEVKNPRCPRYALEGYTNDNQRVRIVFAQCNEKTEVVTVIDLGREWQCHCPGDDDKFKNRN